MKRCPMCDRTFDDTQTFCANDGTALINESASPPAYDPMKTIVSTPPPQSAPLPPQDYGSGGLPGGAPAPGSWQTPSAPQGGSAWGAPPPPPMPGAFGAPQAQQTGLALASLILGILSLICLGPLTAIPALILGFMALSRIKSDPATYGGRGLAIGGMATAGVSLAILVLYIIIVIIAAIAR